MKIQTQSYFIAPHHYLTPQPSPPPLLPATPNTTNTITINSTTITITTSPTTTTTISTNPTTITITTSPTTTTITTNPYTLPTTALSPLCLTLAHHHHYLTAPYKQPSNPIFPSPSPP